MGLDVASGEPADPHLAGVLDNYIVKRQILQRWVGVRVVGVGGWVLLVPPPGRRAVPVKSCGVPRVRLAELRTSV